MSFQAANQLFSYSITSKWIIAFYLAKNCRDLKTDISRSLQASHIQNPFLRRHDVKDIFERIYDNNDQESNECAHEKFWVLMVLAISSLVPYRKGEHDQHPFGYYLSAMGHFHYNFLARGIASIQDLLIVCRFGIFHHIGMTLSMSPFDFD